MQLASRVEARLMVAGVSFSGKPPHLLPQPRAVSFDERNRTLANAYEWGTVKINYAVTGNQLEITVTVANSGSDPISAIQVRPLHLILPKRHDNMDATAGYTGAMLRHEKGAIGLANLEINRPVQLRLRRVPGFAHSESSITTAISIETEAEVRPLHPVVDAKYFVRPGMTILPGQTEQLRIFLAFGAPDATSSTLLGSFHEHVAKTLPMTFQWPDRRPIGQIFLSHPDRKWPTNPRGYRVGKGEREDVTTGNGLQDFGGALMKYADQCLQIMKQMDAQGVIVWDLEGQEMPHDISYVGSPERLAQVAPEMDRFADAFMKKFTDAGYRVGVTIRPTQFYAPGDPKKPRWWHRDVRDPVALMAEKIAYAKKRWKATIVYLDSNVFGSVFDSVVTDKRVPYIMPGEMIRALHRLHPDVLIIPEWSDFEYFRYSAAYSSPNQRRFGTDTAIRAVYPKAFSVSGSNTTLFEDNWETLVGRVQAGDVLLYRTWYAAPENAYLRLFYREAQLRNQGGVRRQPSISDPDPVVRRQALRSFKDLPAASAPTVTQLLTWLRKPASPEDAAMRMTVADALGSMGDAAVPELVAFLAQNDEDVWRYAIAALGRTRTKDPRAHAALMPFLEARGTPRAQYREAAVIAMGELRAVQAVPVLLAVLDEKDRSGEHVRQAAVAALGKIGDPRATSPLIAQFERTYTTVVTYSIHRTLDDALALLTGQQHLMGKEDWTRWRDRSR